MGATLVHIGFSNIITADRVIAIAAPGSAPIKRRVVEARDKGQIIDLTNGRRTKAVIFTDSNQIILSALETSTIKGRTEAAILNGGVNGPAGRVDGQTAAAH